MADDDEGDDDVVIRRLPRDTSPEITLLAERLRTLSKRVRELEKKQGEVTTLLNKGLGIAAFVMAIGAGIGWLISIGGNILKWFRP